MKRAREGGGDSVSWKLSSPSSSPVSSRPPITARLSRSMVRWMMLRHPVIPEVLESVLEISCGPRHPPALVSDLVLLRLASMEVMVLLSIIAVAWLVVRRMFRRCPVFPASLDLDPETLSGPRHPPDLASASDPLRLDLSALSASTLLKELRDSSVVYEIKVDQVCVTGAAELNLRFVPLIAPLMIVVILWIYCFVCVDFDPVLGNGSLAMLLSSPSRIFTALTVMELQSTRAEMKFPRLIFISVGIAVRFADIAHCKTGWLLQCEVILMLCCFAFDEREGLTARDGTWLQLRAVQLVVAMQTRNVAILIVYRGLTARVGASTSLRTTRNYGMLRRTKNVPPGNYGMPRHTKNVPSRIYGTRWRTKNVPGWNYGIPLSAKNDPPQRALAGSSLFIVLLLQLITSVLQLCSSFYYASFMLSACLLCISVGMVYRSRELATHQCNLLSI